jgi:16S rRNA (cytosine967-C5)-methyltransferase
MQRKQVAILRSALEKVELGGRLVYSTCSLEPEENERVVEEVVNPSFRLVDCAEVLSGLKKSGALVGQDVAQLCRGPYLRTIPGVHPCDGFFAAVIERS